MNIFKCYGLLNVSVSGSYHGVLGLRPKRIILNIRYCIVPINYLEIHTKSGKLEFRSNFVEYFILLARKEGPLS